MTSGEINKLLINVPPGSMKSLLTGVIWPAWEWGPKARQELRYLGTAHSQNLAVRDNTKSRRLISSAWYQERWHVVLTSDQNQKTKFENDKTGFREAMAFTSMTGSRGDRVILDDPISADSANSEKELENAKITFTESLPTRVNNEDSAIVVIMQRLHSRDTSGVILSRELPYEHLLIPMRYEEGNSKTTSIGWTDPRTKDGEIMFPERFPEKAVKELETTLGSYAAAGQLQQRPVPRGGGMFKRSWFPVQDAPPATIAWVRGWDLAATDSPSAARTAGVKIGRDNEGRYWIGDVAKDQLSPAGVDRMILNTAAQDGRTVKGALPSRPRSIWQVTGPILNTSTSWI